MPFIPNSDADRKEMLETIGVSKFEDLLDNIPKNIRYSGDLNVGKQLSEYEVSKLLSSYAKMNTSTDSHVCFMGGGAYDRFIPSIVGDTINRAEFRTAYTPYQAEVSQGTLQVMYEFQTMIAELTGMDLANASMYDGATSFAEACLLANAQTKKTEVLVLGTINPRYLETAKTLCKGRGLSFTVIKTSDGRADINLLKEKISAETCAVCIQQPNFYGSLEEVFEIQKIVEEFKALYISIFDPITLGMTQPPASYGADIAVGEGQQLGIAMSFGGPYLGLFACKQKYVRKLPGRIAGMTTDENGTRAFTLTLQTREQQIKREKATSNICTNQGLFMLAATVFMETLGGSGIKQIAENSYDNAHYLAHEICKINGFEMANQNEFIFEFTIKTPVNPQIIIDEAPKYGILAGVNANMVSEDNPAFEGLIVATTEIRTKEEMNNFVDFLKKYKS